MIDTRRNLSPSVNPVPLALGALGLLVVIWQVSLAISAGNTKTVSILAAAIVVCAVAAKTLNDWRTGIYLFMVWVLFEDMIRKYMGNNMLIYFGKDALVAIIYIAFVMSRMRGELRDPFRPPFRFALGLFVLLGFAQVFNSGSPSLWYGMLGLKLYFYYVPLMFVGYAMLRNERDLQTLLFVNAGLAVVIALIGILQGIFGLDFLNPHGAREFEELGHLVRMTPSGVAVPRPPSVFVSDGRFAWYLILVMPLLLGAAGYLLLRTKRGRYLVFPALALVATAAIVSGSRGGAVWVTASAIAVPLAMLWGAPPKAEQAYALAKAVRRSAIFVVLALAFVIVCFPKVMNGPLTFYRETVALDSPDSETLYRAWDYPVKNFSWVFDDRDWPIGHGIGTASLGAQYVSGILGAPKTTMFSESGVGFLIIELGILGPFIWLFWSSALMFTSGVAALKVKGTWAFPLAFSILWYAFVLLFPLTWGGINPYQNFVNNAYLWLLIGVLFRLPGLVAEQKAEDGSTAEAYRLAPASGRAPSRAPLFQR
jgi:hypothetical protein